MCWIGYDLCMNSGRNNWTSYNFSILIFVFELFYECCSSLHAEFSINVDISIFFLFSQSFLHLLGGAGTSVLIRTAIWHEFNGLHGSEYFTSWK